MSAEKRKLLLRKRASSLATSRKPQAHATGNTVNRKNGEDLGGASSFPQVSAVVSAYIDGDLAGFCLIRFRHLYFEYAIAIIGANRIRLHGLR